MPAKGKYFFHESDGDCKITDPLYEKYRYSSQQHPLLLFLLGIVFAYCVTLIVVLCTQDDPREHLTFTVTVCMASAIFIVIYVLVYIESLFWCRLKLFAAVIWVCLLVLGYVSVFDKGEAAQVAAWEQMNIRRPKSQKGKQGRTFSTSKLSVSTRVFVKPQFRDR